MAIEPYVTLGFQLGSDQVKKEGENISTKYY